MLPRLWDPFDDMDQLMRRNLPALNDDFNRKGFVPAVDVYETNEAVVIETLLPGVNPEQVEVSVEKGVLTIEGESQREHEIDEKNYYRKEIRRGSFFRSIPLPAKVNGDKAVASIDKGVLRISIPKTLEKKAKAIKINISKNK